jgi:hypothetical protein
LRDRCKSLHLLSAPPTICLAHILRRLDGRDELENHVRDADDTNDRPEDDVHGIMLKEDGAAEDVD